MYICIYIYIYLIYIYIFDIYIFDIYIYLIYIYIYLYRRFSIGVHILIDSSVLGQMNLLAIFLFSMLFCSLVGCDIFLSLKTG